MTEDSRIIELLELRDERALSEMRRKYSKSCQSIAYNILGNCLDAVPPAHTA